eukprot:CAMPEP_0194320994 /NCGR_PEP_ID=MMETSP0171-20130528/17239_1 /TAXON_ID=218684 /ORGANISM="Corethron pennatum, Strain L29A3" /LENGTH=1523 /DNA_ID=CAMNT_0039078715 /DNA_START=272 /DNA_END=4840 /DNA_ORIENTATION=+
MKFQRRIRVDVGGGGDSAPQPVSVVSPANPLGCDTGGACSGLYSEKGIVRAASPKMLLKRHSSGYCSRSDSTSSDSTASGSFDSTTDASVDNSWNAASSGNADALGKPLSSDYCSGSDSCSSLTYDSTPAASYDGDATAPWIVMSPVEGLGSIGSSKSLRDRDIGGPEHERGPAGITENSMRNQMQTDGRMDSDGFGVPAIRSVEPVPCAAGSTSLVRGSLGAGRVVSPSPSPSSPPEPRESAAIVLEKSVRLATALGSQTDSVASPEAVPNVVSPAREPPAAGCPTPSLSPDTPRPEDVTQSDVHLSPTEGLRMKSIFPRRRRSKVSAVSFNLLPAMKFKNSAKNLTATSDKPPRRHTLGPGTIPPELSEDAAPTVASPTCITSADPPEAARPGAECPTDTAPSRPKWSGIKRTQRNISPPSPFAPPRGAGSIVAARAWDVTAPPPVNTLAGQWLEIGVAPVTAEAARGETRPQEEGQGGAHRGRRAESVADEVARHGAGEKIQGGGTGRAGRSRGRGERRIRGRADEEETEGHVGGEGGAVRGAGGGGGDPGAGRAEDPRKEESGAGGLRGRAGEPQFYGVGTRRGPRQQRRKRRRTGCEHARLGVPHGCPVEGPTVVRPRPRDAQFAHPERCRDHHGARGALAVGGRRRGAQDEGATLPYRGGGRGLLPGAAPAEESGAPAESGGGRRGLRGGEKCRAGEGAASHSPLRTRGRTGATAGGGVHPVRGGGGVRVVRVGEGAVAVRRGELLRAGGAPDSARRVRQRSRLDRAHGVALRAADETEDLCESGDLFFEVRDHSFAGMATSLGGVAVDAEILVGSDGERLEFPLDSSGTLATDVRGTLALRFRLADKKDIDFMLDLEDRAKGITSLGKQKEPGNNKSNSRISIHSPTAKTSGQTFTNALGITQSVTKDKEGIERFRVQPCPDPDDVEKTSWLTREELTIKSSARSTRWLSAGSGKLGRIHLEVLGCRGLPNMDTGILGDYTDAFVCAVFEDAIVQTDVIFDTLSPKWMPWCQRAFILNVTHPSSQLFLGVFDYGGMGKEHGHIGRIAINISNYSANTDYVQSYRIFPSSHAAGKDYGNITIRLRIEWYDEREVLMMAISPPPSMHLNISKKKNWKVAQMTCEGKYNMDTYSFDTLNGYINELYSYEIIYYYLEDVMNSILLWRTHNVCVLLPSFSFKENRMNYHRKTLKMPLNSMVFAITTLTLIERPELFPSFSCGVVAWLMLSLGNNRLSHPSPWERPHSFLYFFSIIAFGRSPSVWSIIKPFEKDLDCADYDNGWEQFVQKAKEAAEKRSADYAASQSPNAAGKNAKSGKSDPATLLFPIQKKLMLVCKHLKFVGNIITWEESYLSFWVTVSSIVLSVVFLIVPWRLVVFWCARICAWTILGPWMKLVDLYLKGVEEMKKRNREYEKVKEEEVTKMQMYGARVKLEDEEKMRDMKIHKFGRYIVRVPQRSLARQKDIPLPESYAKHFVPPSRRSVLGIQVAGIEEEYETVLPGQHLTGSMVPKTEKKYNDAEY